VDDVVGRDADEVLVERSVVDRAQAEPVAHGRLAAVLNVAEDVCSVEKAELLQPADCTLASVRQHDAAAKPCLA